MAALLAVALLASCRPTPSTPDTVEFTGSSMGTTWSVRVVDRATRLDATTQAAVQAVIQDELNRVDFLMSTWNGASELSRFNASPSLEPFAVSPETFEVFQWSARLWEETGGTLDPTLAPLIDAWGFGRNRSVPVPDDATVARLRADVGMPLVELDPHGAWVRKRRAGVRVDFSALAPGYAADRVQAALAARGLHDVLIDVSGELIARGRNADGQPWQVAIERPRTDGRGVARVVPLVDRAMATSGDYRNYRDVGGVRLPHILDPATGRPVGHALTSVTVFDALAVRADALSTALLVMGPERAMAFARSHDVPAVLLVRTADTQLEERTSPAFDAMIAAAPK